MNNKVIQVKGKLLSLQPSIVMGILNITPDSFYAGSRKQTEVAIHSRIEAILSEGAGIIDVGGYSSRPGAAEVSPVEERQRLALALKIVQADYPEAIVSIDTFRADVARFAVEEYGADIINDIAGGELDTDMFRTIASLKVPYILMHMRGTPQAMQQLTAYDNMIVEIRKYFADKIYELESLGVNDIILDPGFGFSKTLDQNYELMAGLKEFAIFNLPLLVGISRKSMIYKLLGSTPDDSLNGTSVLNTLAILNGGDILRVHDVKAAVEVARIVGKYQSFQSTNINKAICGGCTSE